LNPKKTKFELLGTFRGVKSFNHNLKGKSQDCSRDLKKKKNTRPNRLFQKEKPTAEKQTLAVTLKAECLPYPLVSGNPPVENQKKNAEVNKLLMSVPN